MKNKKPGDKNNWKAEWTKEAGSKMVQSLAILFNRVEEENKILMQQRETKLKSVYKGGNKERILCKVYERVKELQKENKHGNISNMQTAEKKGK